MAATVQLSGSGDRRETLRKWSWRRESNPRPADYKSAALPTELRQRVTKGQPLSAHCRRASWARQITVGRQRFDTGPLAGAAQGDVVTGPGWNPGAAGPAPEGVVGCGTGRAEPACGVTAGLSAAARSRSRRTGGTPGSSLATGAGGGSGCRYSQAKNATFTSNRDRNNTLTSAPPQ